MISNQVLQNTLDGLRSITRTDLCITDTEGKVLASTFSETVCTEDEVLDSHKQTVR
jgi:carbohydrate diacid regulator